ncbi:hypothetical protein EYF80_016469 [Liparis tanakae]|uniref:Uncharacterized protein n=1 Tax=Liparis tanakae TaxID=230148 RepID=A0A4Z2I5I5_9TELE|nr:hypothetical protein EYF80_016469 [Liparis tanakae]
MEIRGGMHDHCTETITMAKGAAPRSVDSSCGGDMHRFVCWLLALSNKTWKRLWTSGRHTCSRSPSTISSSRS